MNAVYAKDIGRYENFPVSDIGIIKKTGSFFSWFLGYAVAVGTDGQAYKLSLEEYELLTKHMKRWKDICYLNAVITEQKTAMQNRGS